jgi:hypothetical protein
LTLSSWPGSGRNTGVQVRAGADMIVENKSGHAGFDAKVGIHSASFSMRDSKNKSKIYICKNIYGAYTK